MPSVTLTPDMYYQVGGQNYSTAIVTDINPATKYFSIYRYYKAVYLRIPIDATEKYAHSVITANYMNFTGYNTSSSFRSYTAYDKKRTNGNVLTLTLGNVETYNSTSDGFNIAIRNIIAPTSTESNANISLAPMGQASTSGYIWLVVYQPSYSYDAEYHFTSASVSLDYLEVAPEFSILPSGGYLQPSVNNTLTLSNTNSQNMLLPYKSASGTLYYKKSDAATYSSITYTGDSVTVPAGTFENGATYEVYADVVTEDGSTCTTDTYTYTTTDTIGTTTGQTPNNSIEYGTVTFTWTYRNSTGTAQYAYDLDISDDGETYTTVLSHVVTSATTATYNVSTAGGKYWRVRGYNQNDVAGDYSTPLYFVNNIPPSPPVITNITGAGRLTVTWAADNQSAYEVEVYNGDTRVYDSTVVYSADTTHLINEYLPNGTYTIKVKVINVYGHESDYSTTVYSITNVGGINVTGSYENGTATLTYSGNYVLYYIQRDGVTIAKTTATTHNDLYMNGTATYTVIAVNSDDSYAIGTATVTGTVPFTRFVDLEGNVYDISKRWQQRIGVQVSNEAEYDTALYLGAKRPAHTFGTGRIRRYAIAFTYEGDYTVFMGKVLRYMDIYGNADYVVVPNINEVEARYGNELTASLEVTDYNEGITYDL